MAETEYQRRLRVAEEQWLASNKPPMPDCAVVDEREAFLDRHPGAWLGFALEEAIPKLKQQAIEEYIASQPRARSAVSEDGQWLVVLNASQEGSVWEVRFLDEFTDSYRMAWPQGVPYIEDTGQDAHEVLREWLAGQKGCEG